MVCLGEGILLQEVKQRHFQRSRTSASLDSNLSLLLRIQLQFVQNLSNSIKMPKGVHATSVDAADFEKSNKFKGFKEFCNKLNTIFQRAARKK